MYLLLSVKQTTDSIYKLISNLVSSFFYDEDNETRLDQLIVVKNRLFESNMSYIFRSGDSSEKSVITFFFALISLKYFCKLKKYFYSEINL